MESIAHIPSVSPAGKPGKKLSKLQQHNSLLSAQLSDANKRIARLRFERSLLLDKLFEFEKRGGEIDVLEGTWSSESEGEYRDSEWWRDVDLGAVLARNPISTLPGQVIVAPATKKQSKRVSKKRIDVTSEEDLDTEDDYSIVRSSNVPVEFDAPPSTAGSSPPNKKRRPNKASATDAVLKTIAVEYDVNNRPILPLVVGVVTIEELGDIVYDRQAYHNRRYILPVGFHSTRSYLSTVDPNASTIYHSQIMDGGTSPVFQVTAEDAPGALFLAPTSTGAWSAVVRAANQLRSRDYSNSASGPDYYGLSNATVAMLIEDLPNSNRCINYQRKRFERGAAHVKTASKKAADESDQISGIASEMDASDYRQTRIDSLLNATSSLNFD